MKTNLLKIAGCILLFISLTLQFCSPANESKQPDPDQVQQEKKVGDSYLHQVINKASDNDTIFIEEGKYFIDIPLEFRKTIHVVGKGNVEIISTSMEANVVEIYNYDGNISLINLRLRHQQPLKGELSCAGNVIMVDGVKTLLIKDCEINGCGVVGIYDNGQLENLVLHNNYIHSNSGCAIYYKGQQLFEQQEIAGIVFKDNRIENNGLINDTLTKKYLDSHNFEMDEIDDFPRSGLDAGAKSAWVAVADEGKKEMSLLFQLDDSLFVVKSKVIESEEGYMCNRPDAIFEDGKIVVSCNMQKAIFQVNKYSFHGNRLTYLSGEMVDENEKVYEEAEKALKANDPLAYCNAYIGAQYYSDFSSRGIESLKMADELCSKMSKSGQYRKAAELMHAIETECNYPTSKETALLDEALFKRVWGNASLFYLKSGMYTECSDLCKWFTSIYPDYTGVYLQWGDALYNLKQEDEAKQKYGMYKKLVEKNKNIAEVPSRVLERLGLK